MAKGIAKQISLGIARETTRGTSPGSATFWLPWMEFNLDEKKDFVEDVASIGMIEDAQNAAIAKATAEGSLKGLVSDKTFPLLLYSILGTLNTAANTPESGVSTHTVTVAQNAQHPTLSYYLDDPVTPQDYTFPNGVLTSLELKYERGSYIQFSAGLKAKKGATATFTPTSNTENRFIHKHVTFKLAANLAGLAGASAMNIMSLSLKIDPHIEEDLALGSVDPVDFLNKELSIEGTLEAVWNTEADYKTQFLAGTTKAMRIDLKNTDVTIGTTTNPQITIDLAKVTFKELGKAYKAGDVITQALSFKAYYSTPDAKMVTVAAVNTQASY